MASNATRSIKWWVYALLVGFSLVLFQQRLGFDVLNPNSYQWLMSCLDPSAEYVAWLNYLHTPWHFPVLGTLEGYLYPTKTGVGLTGAVPLLAIPAKALSSLFPENFQHFGFWFLICFVLQSVFSVRLLKALALRNNIEIPNWGLIVSSLFFLLSAPWLMRQGHMNLCAHFLIFWALIIYFDPFLSAKAKFRSQFTLVVVTALIHQYLLLMVLGLGFANFWQIYMREKRQWLRFLCANAACLAATACLWFVVGNFIVPLKGMSYAGFGEYSANLNTFWNNMGKTIFSLKGFNELGVQRHFDGQYEGSAYLGLGGLGLVLAAGILQFSPKMCFKNLISPLFFVVTLFTFFAFSHVWTFNNTVLFKAEYLMHVGAFKYLSSAFRGSGRFIWILYYILLAYALVRFFSKNIPKIAAYSFLGLCLGLQIYDLFPLTQKKTGVLNAENYKLKIDAEAFAPVFQESDKVIVVPPYAWQINTHYDFLDFALLAAQRKQPITAGYLARHDFETQTRFTQKLDSLLEEGQLSNAQMSLVKSIFILPPSAAYKLAKLQRNNLISVYELNGYLVGVPKILLKTNTYLDTLEKAKKITIQSEDLTGFLLRHESNTVILSVKDEASRHLCGSAKAYFTKVQSGIPEKLGYNTAYVGVFFGGKCLSETFDAGNVETVFSAQNLKALKLPESFKLEVISRTRDGEKTSIMRLGGQNFSPNRRGFNVLVLDSNFKPIEKGCFDTYEDCRMGALSKIE
jgi:hypothetical protein